MIMKHDSNLNSVIDTGFQFKNGKKFLNIYLFFVVLLFATCGTDLEEPEKPEIWPVGQNVYVAGFENNAQENPEATLWKNGVLQNLGGTDGSIVRSSDEDLTLYRSEASSVFVSGDDVYVAGYEIFQKEVKETENSVHYEYIMLARLWKNGTIQNLSHGTLDDVATSVFVSGNDVYVLGYEILENPNKFALKFWKNGKAEIFAEVGKQTQVVNSIFVSEGDVYIAGRIENQAKLWKNGVEFNLIGGTNAYSVFVSGNDVYVAGCGDGAKLWKNSKAENLTDGTKNAAAYSVYILGNDVYVAGHDGFERGDAKLWKNGVVQNLPETQDAMIFQSAFISGEDIYLAGYVEAIKEAEPGSLPIGYYKATLWKNGKKLNLNVGKDTYSNACSVFVK